MAEFHLNEVNACVRVRFQRDIEPIAGPDVTRDEFDAMAAPFICRGQVDRLIQRFVPK